MASPFPRYTLKFYNAAGALQYTITNEALSIVTHTGLNEDVGWFTIILPTVKGIPSAYSYTDIAKNWYIKLWLDWGTATDAGDPDFMGRVYNAQTNNPIGQGFVRVISGKGNSEILERRIKSRQVYGNIAADLVFIELASDLGLTDDFDADASLVTLTVDEESYLDFTKRLSDYWVDAGTQLKKDFLVDARNYFVWKNRPMRTAGVETLSTFLDYNVVRDSTQVKNNIKVYGRKVPYVGLNNASNQFQIYQIFGRKDPTDGDSYTHGAGWVDIQGVTSSQSATPDPAVGANYTQSDSDDTSHDCEFYRMLASSISCEGYAGYDAIEFWGMRYAMGNSYIRLYCPDDSSYYQAGSFQIGDVDNTWKFHRYSLGLANTYNASSNPNGQWTAVGTPDWERISGIYFGVYSSTMDAYCGVDGLCFNFGRWRGSGYSAPSVAAYGQHDLTVINDDLNSDDECEIHAMTLLYQRDTPVIRLDLKVQGNNNILVGDRLVITLAAENISAQLYYVTSVEHHFTKEPAGWETIATLVNTINTRRVPSASPQDAILAEVRRQRDIAMGRLSKIG